MGEGTACRKRRLRAGAIVPFRTAVICDLDMCQVGEEAVLGCLWSKLPVPQLGLAQGGEF